MDESYKKRMAVKYRNLSPSEKPSIELCEACQNPTYLTEVCQVTGYYHLSPVNCRTICGIPIDSETRFISGSQLVEYIDKLKISWEKPKVRKVLVDETSISLLQSYCQSIQWRPSVYGILYGRFSKSEGIVEVHSVYEVEQIYTSDGFREELDSRISKVDQLAQLLGFQRVGVVIGHYEDPKKQTLFGDELIWAIQNHSRFGDFSIFITLTPSQSGSNTHVEAWQVGTQSVHLYRSKYLSKSKNPGFLHSKMPVEIAESRDGKKKTDCTTSSHEIDVSWLIAPIAVEAFRSPIISNRFVRIHRLECRPPGMENLKNYMNDPERKKLGFLDKLNDFHVLIFLMENLLDVNVDLPLLVDAIRTKNLNIVDGIKLIIDSCIDNS